MAGRQSFSAIELGGLAIDPPVVLAPMAGYTDTAMRSICIAKGARLAYTEVTQAAAIVRRVPVIMHSLKKRHGEHPLVGHIYGNDPATMADAAAIIEATGDYAAIDINCGCPVRKIVAKGCGVALMRDPPLIGRIVERVKSNVSIPVMVKTRLGFTPSEHNAEQVARIAEAAGADAIAVHARYAVDQHSGPADWTALGRIKEVVDIPLIGNGGVRSAADAEEMQRLSGVDGVMVGRGAIGNPWVFEEICAAWEGKDWTPPSDDEKLQLIRTHLERLTEYIASQREVRRRFTYPPERTACLKFRGHLVRYLGGTRGVKELMRAIDGIYTVDGLMTAIEITQS